MARFLKFGNIYIESSKITKVARTETLFRKTPQLEITHISPTFEGNKMGNFFDGTVSWKDKVDTITYTSTDERDQTYRIIKEQIVKNSIEH